MSPQHLMSFNPRVTPRTARRIAAVLGSGVLVLAATACGSSDDPTNASAQTGNGNGAQTSQRGGGQFPGADGLVAAVTGSTAQVQSQGSGQVAVTWNGSTTFTKQVAGKLADVTVGSCVMVTPVEDTSGTSDSSTDTPATGVTAATVRITAKSTDGTCAGGAGGPQFSSGGPGGAGGAGGAGGQPPAGAEGGTPPSGAPTGAPGGDGSGRPQVRAFGGTFGEVTAVTADAFTVKATVPQRGTGSGSTPSTGTATVAVTVTGTTAYTTTATAAASDVKVGVCVRAQGTTDDTGAVTAKTVAISPATDGACTGGFRRYGNGPGAGAGPATNQES